MKRKRDMDKRSELKSAIEELSLLAKLKPGDDPASAHIPTKPFLHVCNLILQVLDKIGPTMAVLRQDIHQNIQGLEMVTESDPSQYSNLVEMLKKEASEGNTRKGTSCSKAFLWLTRHPYFRILQVERSMDFTVALLQRLAKDHEQNMEQAVEESYNVTLKQWHGWISSAAFKIALKLVPDNKTFISLLMEKDETVDALKEDMQTLITLLAPILEDCHSILKLYHLDRLKST